MQKIKITDVIRVSHFKMRVQASDYNDLYLEHPVSSGREGGNYSDDDIFVNLPYDLLTISSVSKNCD